MTNTVDKINTRPIIAIIGQSIPGYSDKSFIAASYIKAIESAGGRVVPISINADVEEIELIFSCVNGILLPGGGNKLIISNHYKIGKQLYDLAREANDRGDYFPIWGTCLGFEGLVVMVQGSKDILINTDSTDVALPLIVTENATESRLLSGMPATLFETMQIENLTFNQHKFGFSPQVFESEDLLKRFFKVLTTNVDKAGNPFVSTIEAYDYPFYGVQWHPEKNNFEFKESQRNIPHGTNSVLLAQHMSNFFVSETQKNFHQFPSKEMEEEYLIYRYKPIRPDHTLPTLSNFEQVYIF